jgi:hypothetical protein
MMMDAQGLYEIYDFWHVPFWQRLWFKLSVGGALVILCLGLLIFAWRFIRVRKNKKPVWERALAEINSIRERDLDNLEVRCAVYDHVTRLLKEYCVERYGWDVGGCTDREIIIFLTSKHVDLRMQEAFERIARGSELVKFAQENVNRDRVLADCLLCEEFIRVTIPSEQR